MRMQSLGPKAIAFPAPLWCVSTYSSDGKPNVVAVAWGGMCSSQPPALTVSLSRVTVSHGNIEATGAFCVNVPSEDRLALADHFGVVSGAAEDKFAASGLTPVKSSLVEAPYIAEFPLVYECRVTHAHGIGLHTLFVGEILDVKADAAAVGPTGSLLTERLKPVLYSSPSNTYHRVGDMLGRAFFIGRADGRTGGGLSS